MWESVGECGRVWESVESVESVGECGAVPGTSNSGPGLSRLMGPEPNTKPNTKPMEQFQTLNTKHQAKSIRWPKLKLTSYM